MDRETILKEMDRQIKQVEADLHNMRESYRRTSECYRGYIDFVVFGDTILKMVDEMEEPINSHVEAARSWGECHAKEEKE